MSIFIFIIHNISSISFLFLAVMGFHSKDLLWQSSSCTWTGSAGRGQWWGGQSWVFVFFLDTNTGLLYVIPPPPPPAPSIILNHYIVVLYIFDKNDLMYWDYYCLKIIVSWEGNGAKFILDTNTQKKKSMLIVINLLILTLTLEVHY